MYIFGSGRIKNIRGHSSLVLTSHFTFLSLYLCGWTVLRQPYETQRLPLSQNCGEK